MGQILGIVGPRDLAQLFNSLGYAVVGGGTFREAAQNIRAEQEKSGLFPVIVVDEATSAIKPWVANQSRRTEIRVIPSDTGMLAGSDFAVEVPTTAFDILAGFGLPVEEEGAALTQIGSGGILLGAEPAPAAAPAPAAPEAVTEDEDTLEPEPVLANPRPEPDFDAEPVRSEPAHDPTPQRVTPDPTPEVSQVSPAVPSASPADLGSGYTSAVPVPPPAPAAPAPAPEQVMPEPRPLSPVEKLFEEPTPQIPSAPAAPAQPEKPVEHAEQMPWQHPVPPAPPQQHMPQPPVGQPYHPHAAQPMQPQVNPYEAPQQPAQTSFTPQPAQPAPWQQQTAPSLTDRRSEFLTQNLQATRDADVVICWAGKGGVGKTSFTLAIAQTAGEAGLKVLVIDGNRGQASVRHNLKLAGKGLPTIYDARTGGSFAAVVTEEQMQQHRNSARGPALFDVVMGPPEDLSSPEHTPAELYANAIQDLRRQYDLIVLDTQIAESHLSDMWNVVMVPLLRGGAWGVGIFDSSASGFDELDTLLYLLVNQGVSSARMLSVANRWPQFSDDDAAFISQRFAGRASLVGSADEDPYFHDRIVAGFIPTDAPAVAPVVNSVLQQITGRDEFAPKGRRRDRTTRRRFGRRRK